MVFGRGKEKTEFKGKYLGGHPLYPKETDVKIVLEEDKLVIQKLAKKGAEEFSIPYSTIMNVGTEREVGTKVAAFTWYKTTTKSHFAIAYPDPIFKQEVTMLFDMDKPEEAQPAIYAKVAEARAHTQT